jgi:hypothetical protein
MSISQVAIQESPAVSARPDHRAKMRTVSERARSTWLLVSVPLWLAFDPGGFFNWWAD